MYELAVVVRQAEIDGFDPVVVLLGQPAHMGAAHGVIRLHAQRHFGMLDEGSEKIEERAIGLADLERDSGVDQRAKYTGRMVLFLGTAVYSDAGRAGFFQAVDEWDTHLLSFDLFDFSQVRKFAHTGGKCETIAHE